MEKKLFKWPRRESSSADDIDIYNDSILEDLMDNDELDPQEEAFLRGYINEL